MSAVAANLTPMCILLAGGVICVLAELGWLE